MPKTCLNVWGSLETVTTLHSLSTRKDWQDISSAVKLHIMVTILSKKKKRGMIYQKCLLCVPAKQKQLQQTITQTIKTIGQYFIRFLWFSDYGSYKTSARSPSVKALGCIMSARCNALLDWQIKEVVHYNSGWVTAGLETFSSCWIPSLIDDIKKDFTATLHKKFAFRANWTVEGRANY